MRFHRRYPFLQRWIADAGLRAILTPEHLAAARFEPTTQGATGGGVLDLLFGTAGRIAVIPFIEVTPAMVLERELTPVVWPEACRALRREHLCALEAQVVPWLQSLALARQLNSEQLRSFSEGIPQDVLRAARAAKFLGAASYAQMAIQCAPYVYAMRLAQGKRVQISDPAGATGAALLAAIADVRADLGNDERNTLAGRWFGADIFGLVDGLCDVAVHPQDAGAPEAPVRIVLDAAPAGSHPVQIAQPVPTDVLFSFDPQDSPAARTFGVFSNREVEARPREQGAPSQGGSAGHILILLRDTWQSAADADADEAQALAHRLEAEGFTVRVCGPDAALRDPQPADMVHVFTLHHADELLEAVSRYASFGTPVVATAALPRIMDDTIRAPHTLMTGFVHGDEMTILDGLDLLELHVGNAVVKESEPRQGYAEAIRALLAHVRAVVVNGETEAQALREKYAYGGAILGVPAPASHAQPEPVLHLVGDRPFALVHAPIEARTNLPLVARAAAECGIPLVACGDVVDPTVQRVAAEILGPGFVHIARPTPGELESLYRSARLFIDVSWMPRGLSRIARAVACGCPVLVSQRSHALSVWPGLAGAEPGSFRAIRDGLARLWETPATVAPRPADEAFLGVVAAYAQAQSAHAPA